MQTSANGRLLIQLFEKFEAVPYPDQKGIWTVAFGHALLDPNGHQITDASLVREAMIRTFGTPTVTRTQADAQMAKDLVPAEGAVAHAGPASQCQFDAMVSMAFNIGGGAFRSSSVCRMNAAGQHTIAHTDLTTLAERSKVITNASDIGDAFVEWSKENHVWVLGLFRRRAAEVLLYTGVPAQHCFDLVEAFRG